MPNPTNPPGEGNASRLRIRPWLFGGAAALCGIAMLAGLHFLADNYLRSATFRKALDDRASNSLNADAHFSALTGDCTTLRADQFEAVANGRGSAFSHLAAEDIRASPNLLQLILHHALSMDNVEAETLSVELGGEPASPADEPAKSQTMDVESIEIHRLNLGAAAYSPGSVVQGVHLTMKRSLTLWNFTGAGGSFERAGFPPLALEKVEGQASSEDVLVQKAILHGASGTVLLHGNVQLTGDRTVALDGAVQALPLESILPEDWRAQIRGPVSGAFVVSGSLNDLGHLETSGHLTLEQGLAQALPILHKMAPFLGPLDGFGEVSISNGSADFTVTGSEIHIRNLTLESGVCRIQGGLVISPSGALSGQLQVGIAPLDELAGILRRVFTEERGGYLWTSVHVSGTTSFPAEDLSPRISAAAASEIKSKGNNALKGAADFLGSLFNN